MGCAGYPGQDPSKLPGAGCCSAGPSHCVADERPPARPRQRLRVLRTAGSACPIPSSRRAASTSRRSCTAKLVGIMLHGVCLSECITLVSSNPRRACSSRRPAARASCASPASNPLDMQPTGACSITTSSAATAAPTAEGGRRRADVPVHGPADPRSDDVPGVQPDLRRRALRACRRSSRRRSSRSSRRAPARRPASARPTRFIASAGDGVPKTCTSSPAPRAGACRRACPRSRPSSALAAGRVRRRRECAPCFNPVAADPDAARPARARSPATSRRSRPRPSSCPYTGPPIIDPERLPRVQPGVRGRRTACPRRWCPRREQSQLAHVPRRLLRAGLDHVDRGRGRPADVHVPRGRRGALHCRPACPAIAGAGGAAARRAPAPAGEKCAPCFNPVAADPKAPTGACTLGCDKPAAAADDPHLPVERARRSSIRARSRLRQRRVRAARTACPRPRCPRPCSRSSRHATAARASARRIRSSPRATTSSRRRAIRSPARRARARASPTACPP